MELEHLIREKKKDYIELLQELKFLEKSIDQCRIKRREEEQHLQSKREQLYYIRRDVDAKKREYNSLRMSMREMENGLDKKETRLKQNARDIEDQAKDLERKEMNYQVRVKVLEKKEEHCKALKSKEKLFEERVKEFCSKEKLCFEEQVNVHEGRVKDLELKEKQFQERLNELYSKEEEQIKVHEGRVKDLELKDKIFVERGKDLDSKEEQRVKAHEERVKDLEFKEKKFLERVQELEKEFDERVKDLDLKEEKYEEKLKEFCSKEKLFLEEQVNVHEGRVKDLELKEKQFQERLNELYSKEEEQIKVHEGRVKELELKDKMFVERVKDLDSKEEQRVKAHEERVKDLEFKEKKFLERAQENEKEFDERVKVLVSMDQQAVEREEKIDSKEEQIDGRMRELDSMEKQIEEQMKDLEFKKNQYEEQVKKLESQVKELETKQNRFEDNIENVQLLNNLVEKHEVICSQVSDVLQTSPDPAKLVLDTIKGFRPSQHERTTQNLLMNELNKTSSVISFQVKEEAIKFASEWKEKLGEPDKDCLEVLHYFKFVATYEIGSYCQVPQFLSSTESNDNGFLVHLQTSSDPAELVLEMIRKPMLRRGEGIIIDKSHIFLLDQLMRISPHIKPHVQEMAMKLALELKDTATRIAENSLVVLAFLLLLFNYRLISRFNCDQDQVLNLFEFASHHKEAVELFRMVGFADKISDFVKNLIIKQRYIGAVRFICAFKLADKFHLINLLLRQHMEYMKQKVEAKDVEIASLRDILECISDYNLESRDLVTEIKVRLFMLEQEKQKENIVNGASSSMSQVREQKPQGKKRGYDYEAVLASNSKHPRMDVPSFNVLGRQ